MAGSNLLVSGQFASSWAPGDSAFRRSVALMVKLDCAWDTGSAQSLV